MKQNKYITLIYNTTVYVYKFRINLIREMEKLGYKVIVLSPKDEYVEKLDFIEKMIEYSEIIGNDLDFIRVDFYYYKNLITFGEITIYPGAGFEKFPSDYWDMEFGKYWKIK